MSKDLSARDALHEATHRVPGVPRHQDYPKGHHGTTHHGQPSQNRPLRDHDAGSQSAARAHDRPPRVLVGWQNWIAGLFSRRTD